MPRHFAKISLEELKAKVEAAKKNHEDYDPECFDVSLSRLTKTIEDDIKIRFDTENQNDEKSFVWDSKLREPSSTPTDEPWNRIMGYSLLPNGMALLGVLAGGDWEESVYYCIYFDGKKLRAYVPTNGNAFNTKTKQAYGNDDEDDENRDKRVDDKTLFNRNDEKNVDLIVQDIQDRISLSGGATDEDPKLTLRKKLLAIEDKRDRIEQEYKKKLEALNTETSKLRSECPHEDVRYIPDPSGNNDSSYECEDCGKNMRYEFGKERKK